jgi:hypothetical protein
MFLNEQDEELKLSLNSFLRVFTLTYITLIMSTCNFLYSENNARSIKGHIRGSRPVS